MSKWNVRSLQMLASAIVLCFAVTTAMACLWDRDTLLYESRGVPGVVEIITGRVERNPTLYYEMRLDRVTKELDKDPSRLDLYDDAGVACDHLKRGDEAVEWMNRKKARLDAIDATSGNGKDHLYRYHANLGTFYSHRWVRAGANRESMDDIHAGHEHIKAALKINPDAHFGREAMQLKVMDWLIAEPFKDPRLATFLIQPDGSGIRRRSDSDVDEAKSAMKALCGIIALGDAWENVDLFLALKFEADRHEDASIALLAHFRVQELMGKGKNSVSPQCREYFADRGDPDGLRSIMFTGDTQGEPEIKEFYARARSQADAWHQAREAYMLKRMQGGQHPDTHPEFWSGYRETAAPTPPGSILPGFHPLAVVAYVFLGCVALLIVTPILVWWVRRRRTLAATPRYLRGDA